MVFEEVYSFEEASDFIFGVFQSFYVGDVAVCLYRVEEVVGGLGVPVLEGLGFGEVIEGIVDFDGVEVVGVVWEPF